MTNSFQTSISKVYFSKVYFSKVSLSFFFAKCTYLAHDDDDDDNGLQWNVKRSNWCMQTQTLVLVLLVGLKLKILNTKFKI